MNEPEVIAKFQGSRYVCYRDKKRQVRCPIEGMSLHKGERHAFGVYPQVGDKCPVCGSVVTEAPFGIGRG